MRDAVMLSNVPDNHEQCAGCQGGWSYTPVKNKQKLWKTKERRKEHIERRRQGFKTPLGPPL